MVKLSDYVIDFVARQNVKHIFMLPGGGCMHLVDSVGRNKRLKFVGCLHEQAAVVAAEGYAQYKNDAGVALVTTGPGGTNAITGVASAWIDSNPLVVLSGQVKRKDLLIGKGVRQIGVQEVDIISIVRPITKYAVTILSPDDVRYHLEKAFYVARNERPGPVWLDIPLDVQAELVDEKKLKGFDPSECSAPQGKFDSKKIAEIINLLNNAERPVILAGRGIRIAKAEKEFCRLVKALRIPVLTTWRMMDILQEDDGLFFGRPGSIASRYANFVQQNSDFILTIGARLDLPQVGFDYSHFAHHAKKVVVDIDEYEIKKMDMKIDVSVVSDAKIFIDEFIGNIGKVKDKNRSEWISKCKEWKKKYPIVQKEYFNPAKYINTYVFIEILSELLSENDILVWGSSGSCAEITSQTFKVKRGQRVISSPGLGSMGFGLPHSIGVCLASGGNQTICIDGDGGLQHNIQELETLKRLALPVKLFVLNNNGYASIRSTHKRFFDGRLVCCDPSSGLTLPDTCKVASAYGLKAVRITDQKNLRKDVAKVLEAKGPVVCELLIDPDLQTAPRISSIVKSDGSIVSSPLEDLWPFLEREG